MTGDKLRKRLTAARVKGLREAADLIEKNHLGVAGEIAIDLIRARAFELETEENHHATHRT